MEQMDCVITPQAGPGPVTPIQISAHTREGTVRINKIIARNTKDTYFPTIFSEHKKDTGMESIAPNTVPRIAIEIVSNIK